MKLNKQQKRFLVILLVFALFFAIYHFILAPKSEQAPPEGTSSLSSVTSSAVSAPISSAGDMQVYFFDVDQADCALFISPDGKTMLIDAGDVGTKYDVLQKLTDLDITRLDVVVATHPHSDHIGGMQVVIENFEIGSFYLPSATHTSKTFLNMLDAVEARDIDVFEARDGVTFSLGQYVQCEVVGPVQEYDDLNDASAVIHVVYEDISFLMTGDAEKPAEEDMLMANAASSLASTVLKMGHHGSDTSSHEAFFDTVAPTYAVISCGIDNDYGHPNAATLERLAAREVLTYRTDLLGDILVTTNGTEITFDKPGQVPESEAAALEYVYVTDSGKTYHKEDCSSLSKSKNRISYEQAQKNGFSPCKRCFDL